MLVLKDCCIEPGDIVLVVSNSNKPMVRLKQFVQALTTSTNKHGHREVISVFVCTGKNKYGIICHNFERQLCISKDEFIKRLQEQSLEELSVILLNYCNKEFTLDQLKNTLQDGAKWMRHLALKMKNNGSAEELIEQILVATKGDKNKLLELVVVFWRASGQYETLPTVNSSLLVFKHTDNIIRQQFLDAYLKQVNISKQLRAQGKHRVSIFALVKSLFSRSTQDKKDRAKHAPDEKTFCSSNLMQVLNQVDPDLVNRGRNVYPKALEAGLREATKSKTKIMSHEADATSDDFECLIAEQEKLLPPFKMFILPAAGPKLMQVLLTVVDQEIDRIEHKFLANAADKQKAADLKALLLPYRHPKFQTYPVSLQVDISLELIATILPTLQLRTGIVGTWISSTSYANVKSFLRTQGIFDGDIREATANLKNNPPTIVQQQEKSEPNGLVGTHQNSMTSQIYFFLIGHFQAGRLINVN